MNKEITEFDVLGFRVKFTPDQGTTDLPAQEIVERVREEARTIREKVPTLDNGQVAILVALKMAAENKSLSREYRDNITKLRSAAGDALQFIEQVSPTPRQ